MTNNDAHQSYSYDSFGNMVSSGNYTFVQAYTAANQLSGWRYDDAGNLLSDGLGNTYTYDALGQITSDGGTSYVYDPSGDRVAKIGSIETDTMYFGGRPIATISSAGNWDIIYGPTGMLVEVPGTHTASPIYRMTDHLGSSVGTLLASGAVGAIQDLAPFGQLFSGNDNDSFQFTGKERDTESGNDYFGARYYGSSMGRFLSPDWSAQAEPIPYGKLDDPQSLNLYAYVGNNPLSNIDPDGHCDDGSTQCWLEQHAPQVAEANAREEWVWGGAGPSAKLQAAAASSRAQSSRFGGVYTAFVLGAQYGEQSIGTNDQEAVLVRHVGFTDNAQIPGDTLDEQSTSNDGWMDPLTSFHGGARSYYFGGPWRLFGFNAGHVAAGAGKSAAPGLEAHHDAFGPLNPLHWLLESLPSLAINTRDSAVAQPYTCSIAGGCDAQ
jgi:RHS repeat-associated protein